MISSKFLNFLILVTMLEMPNGQNLASPCPGVFSYRYDPTQNGYIGYMEFTNIKVGQVVKMDVVLTVAAKLPGKYVGAIELVGTKEEVFRDIAFGRPVKYKVNFPIQQPLPRVSQVMVNGVLICKGPSVQGSYVTTIRLDYNLVSKAETKRIDLPNTHPVRNIDITDRGENKFEVIYSRPETIFSRGLFSEK